MRRRVCIFDLAMLVHDEDAFLQGVEDFLKQAAFTGQPLHEVGEIDRVERVEPAENPIERGMFFNGHSWEQTLKTWTLSLQSNSQEAIREKQRPISRLDL